MTFTGKAIHSTGVFATVAEDVSDDISMISPSETPLLDALAQAPMESKNVLHEWLEESLGPNTIATSAIVNDDATGFLVHDGSGGATTSVLQVGAVLKNLTTGEYVQIDGTSGNTITVTRGFGSTSAATITANSTWYLVGDAALEGADVVGDISMPRVRKTNYCQIFKKDIIVSGTVQAVNHLGGIDDEYEHQRMARLRESIRDLEKTVIQGILSGNTIGTASAARSMKGLWEAITTNATTATTISTIETLEGVIESAWSRGAEDLDLIIVDSVKKRQLASLQDARVRVDQASGELDTFHKDISFIDTTFGRHKVLRSRWMPSNSAIITSSQRVRVVPLSGRSFAHSEVSRTGDAKKGMVVGEYTLEVRNEEGMAKIL